MIRRVLTAAALAQMHRYDAREIAALFDRGENVINRINAEEGAQQNSTSAILYSYDAQAGSYTEQLKTPRIAN